MFKNISWQTLYWEHKLFIVYSAWKVKMEIKFMKMLFFIVSNIAIVVPMSHPLPWNGPKINRLNLNISTAILLEKK